MSGYTPKVGDKVRATLGENVLVGEVEYADGGAVELRCRGSLFPLYEDSWQFEQIVSVPSKFGAVIRRADGRVFVRDIRKGDEGRYPWSGMDRIQGYFPDEGVSSGGFTVLFDGVDE